MSTYRGPKVKLSRRLGVPISENRKHLESRRLDTPPGAVSSRRPRRLSDYGVRLREKQKLRFYYNVGERQFRRYAHAAIRQKGNSGDNLLRILERRLDNVVRRAGFSASIWQARQTVNHGHVFVNGRRVDIPSAIIKVGDVITICEKSKKRLQFIAELHAPARSLGWLDIDQKALEIRVIEMPPEPPLPFDIAMGMVIEFYN